MQNMERECACLQEKYYRVCIARAAVNESVPEDSHTVSTSVQTIAKVAIQSVASHITHLDTRYLMVKTQAGNHQPLIFACHGRLQQKCFQYTYKLCLLRLGSSLLAGVFLTSSFCVVDESSYSSNEESRSLCWQLGTWTSYVVAPSQQWLHSKTSTLEEAAAETGGCSAPLILHCGVKLF